MVSATQELSCRLNCRTHPAGWRQGNGGKMLQGYEQHYGLFSVETVAGFRCSPPARCRCRVSQNIDLCVLGRGVTSSPAHSLALDNQMTHDGALI